MDCQAITLGEHLLGADVYNFRLKKGDFAVALFVFMIKPMLAFQNV